MAGERGRGRTGFTGCGVNNYLIVKYLLINVLSGSIFILAASAIKASNSLPSKGVGPNGKLSLDCSLKPSIVTIFATASRINLTLSSGTPGGAAPTLKI